jgi:hypothetical protein
MMINLPYSFQASNPFRRSFHSSDNFYVQIRKYVLKNTRSPIRGRLNISGPKEIIGIFANYIFKLCYGCQVDFKKLKELTTTAKELPSLHKVVKSLKNPEKKTSEVGEMLTRRNSV